MIVFGLSRTMWLSMLALAVGSAVDMVSVVLRSTILPLVTPDELRGRVNAVEMVFISGSNELGAFESGVAAGADRRRAGGRGRRHADDRRRGRLVEALPVARPASTGSDELRPVSVVAELSSRPDPTFPDRRIDQLDRVECRQRPLRPAQGLRDLHEAAGVRARERLRSRREDVRSLAVTELSSGVRLDDVVDPGRSAAEILLGGLDHFEVGDAPKRRERRDGQALSVSEVARILQRDRAGQRVARRAGRRLGEELADVANLAGERGGALVVEEPAELLQMGAAAGGVDDDEVDVVEGVDELPGEALALLEAARMHRQRSAAPLRWCNHFVAVCREHAGGRGVHVGEDGALHAPVSRPDARARRSDWPG